MNDYFSSLIDHCAAEWRPVVGYEGLYEVSSHGLVRSVAHKTTTSRGAIKQYKGKILKTLIRRDGYVEVGLCKLGDSQNHLVHRLVSIAFDGSGQTGTNTDHIDCKKWNNRSSNLRRVTVSQNGMHRNAVKYKWLGTRKNGRRWQACLLLGSKIMLSPCFDKREDALAARIKMERELYGEFAPERGE